MKGLDLVEGYVALKFYYKKPSILLRDEDVEKLARCIKVEGVNSKKLDYSKGRCVVISRNYLQHGEIVEVSGDLVMLVPDGAIIGIYSKEETDRMLKAHTATASEISKMVKNAPSPIISPARK